ncbi:MAG: hypothetical protein LBK13_04940 [Spirochaetales bacterium]|jgi:hypothetical protein|nr:hypothetical protein [Spirochaetales bacterium]
MKKIRTLFCLFIIAAIAFTACSMGGDDDDTPPNTLPPTSTTVGGTSSGSVTLPSPADVSSSPDIQSQPDTDKGFSVEIKFSLSGGACQVELIIGGKPYTLIRVSAENNTTFAGTWKLTDSGDDIELTFGGDGNYTMDYTLAYIPIETAAQFQKIGPDYPLSGNYELTANIILPSGWTPIGNGTQPFTGTFDGKGYSITISSFPSDGINISSAPGLEDFLDMISGWYSDSGGIIARGLFACVKDAVIENLDITVNSSVAMTHTAAQQVQLFGTVAAAAVNTAFTDINISSGGVLSVNVTSGGDAIYIGGIAGLLLEGSSISGCTVDVKIQAGLGSAGVSAVGGAVGGLFGNGGITDCSVVKDVEVSGGNHNSIGGLAGDTDGPVINSFVSGNVSVTSAYIDSQVGGLIGNHAGSIENCHVTGNVSVRYTGTGEADIRAGGLTGSTGNFDDDYTVASIKKSYSTGNVSAVSDSSDTESEIKAGGISTNIWRKAEIFDCYSTGNVSASGVGDVNAGGIVSGLSAQNNVTITITRCYASGNISATGSSYNKSAGGIAGSAYKSGGSGSITGCAALSGSITCEGSGTAKRIVGNNNSGFSLSYNIADNAMSGTWTDKGLTGKDGADSTNSPPTKDEYETLGWDFSTVWKMEGSPSRPVLQWQ